MRNKTLAITLTAALSAIAAGGGNINTIDDFYEAHEPAKPDEEAPRRSRCGGKKERERRAKQLAKQQGA